MGKHRKHNNGYTKQQKDAFWTVVTIIAIFALLWVLFWLGVILLVVGLLYLVHFLNKTYGGYRTKWFYVPILSYFIAISLITFGGSEILYKMGVINTTFGNLAVEASDYVSISSEEEGRIHIEPNYEGIIEKAIASNSQSGTTISGSTGNPYIAQEAIDKALPSINLSFTAVFGYLVDFVRAFYRDILSMF